MCGYYELCYSCCGKKYGFQPSEGTKCALYERNRRYCRTGSVHSWIVTGSPLTTGVICEDCQRAEEREPGFIQARSEARMMQADDMTAREQKAREERLAERRLRRVRENDRAYRAEERNQAAEALRSQMKAKWLREDPADDDGASSRASERRD